MMKKIFYFLVVCCFSFCGFAQSDSLILKSFVKNDSIQLRWATDNPNLFIEGLKLGYSIKRTDLVSNEKVTYTIPPFENRKDEYLGSTDTNILLLAEFLLAYSSENFTHEKQKTMPFFGIIIAAGSNRKLSEMCGLYFEESRPINRQFEYQISLNNSSNIEATIKINTANEDVNPDCTPLSAISRVDLKEVYLKWEAKNQVSNYSGYWILKSTDQLNFEKLNRVPVHYMTSEYEPNKSIVDYVDTAVSEGETYYYQIQPINHFGDLGEPSNIAEVYIQKRLNGICKIDSIERKAYQRIIRGEYLSLHDDKIGSYLLYRSEEVDRNFKLIETKKTTDWNFEFIYESDVKSGDRQYFKVAALSVDGDTVYSFPNYHFSYDQEPPAMPTEVSGDIDENGLVNLKWNAPDDSDIRGYRVYRQNSLTDELVEVTRNLSPATNYVDTIGLDNLTSEIYYSVRTVDLNYNNSPITTPILLMKPDTIAPVPPIFKSYAVLPNGVSLSWANSPSKDVVNQGLVKIYPTGIDTISFHSATDTTFLDSLNLPGSKLNYYLFAEDGSNNYAVSEPLNLKFETGIRYGVHQLNATTDRREKTITLTWQYVLNDPIYSVQIYRAKGDGKLRLYETIRNAEQTFIDTDLSPNNQYTYKVQVKYKSGHSSVLSEGVEVMY